MQSIQNWEPELRRIAVAWSHGDENYQTLVSFIRSVEEKSREDERQKLALQIAEETMDLCENSQEFKHRLLQSLNK